MVARLRERCIHARAAVPTAGGGRRSQSPVVGRGDGGGEGREDPDRRGRVAVLVRRLEGDEQGLVPVHVGFQASAVGGRCPVALHSSAKGLRSSLKYLPKKASEASSTRRSASGARRGERPPLQGGEGTAIGELCVAFRRSAARAVELVAMVWVAVMRSERRHAVIEHLFRVGPAGDAREASRWTIRAVSCSAPSPGRPATSIIAKTGAWRSPP